MAYESQGDFMGDDLDTDVDYLTAEANEALRSGEITQVEYQRRMDRIERLIEAEEERSWGYPI